MTNLTKIMTGTILTTLLLTITGTALAQRPDAEPGRKGQLNQRGNNSMPAVTLLMRGVRQLDLSVDQQTSIKAIMRDLKAGERALANEMKAGHEQLKELIKAEHFNEAAVATLAENEGAIAAERLINASRAMSQVYAQLTGEQRAELETMALERSAKRSGKRGQKTGEY